MGDRSMSLAEYTRRVLVALALAAALLAAWRVSGILLLGFGGIVLAVVIRAAATALARHLPIPTRWVSALVVLSLLVLALALAVLLGGEFVGQIDALRQSLPDVVVRLRQSLEQSVPGRALLSMLGGAASARLWAQAAVAGVGLLFNAVTDLLIVVFIALYLSFNPRSYIDGLLSLLPRHRHAVVRSTLQDISTALRDWVLGQLVAMAFVGVLTGLGLWLVGVPHALSLGLLAGLLDFVPVLGPFVAAVPGVAMAYIAGPTHALYAVAVYVIVQQLESALIMPLAQRWAVELPPAAGLLAVVVFGAMFGMPGFLFGVPLAVVLMVLLRRWQALENPAGTPSGGR